MNEDFTDFLTALHHAEARFLVVGAYALAVHGVARATGDLDVWTPPEGGNAERVWAAFLEFGAPVEALGVTQEDLRKPHSVIQLGLPPRRIDVMTSITGVDFETAWKGRVLHTVGALEIPFLGKDALIANKRATGRLRDRADLEALGVLDEGRS